MMDSIQLTLDLDPTLDEVLGYVAFRDTGHRMEPITEDGHLVLFDSLEVARMQAGALGVAAAENQHGLQIVCRRYDVRPPKNGESIHA